ncbi:unconventional myosin-Ic isoform X3 [Parasteatoda tepidariorum]|uniref:unconventional myosin-Ic isoform X3 n=1 Tax=Parasteatoda tepidariorum TaxID=114398 RepID=UPI001C727778|nr:unconventional myosin-Ic isoform X1 [Parasteatoda tepidariorum]XP_042894682.1 unconventional myosin-Ic isoform X2 [Parasteatoda tepidariorum]
MERNSSMENLLHARDKVGVQDFVLLDDYTNENAFIGNLYKRFQENLIYTYIGPVVISVNPYQDLDLYSPEIIEQYQNVNFFELPPHIFAIADTAFRSMREECHDQCILISGESGAGKTEASKKLLQYIAAASHHAPSVENVKDKLLLSNPILEAFGNAKTNRNDNSSRFGKYMDVEFDFLGTPLGGHILHYLLEKSRVVHQNHGERNFHIFYQILSGADDKLLDYLQLRRDPTAYFYLSQGLCSKLRNLDDSDQFSLVKKAMDVTNFSDEEQEAVFAIVASVLHLGNVGFVEEEGHAILVHEKPIQYISKLLGCSPFYLMNALVNKTIEAKQELMSSPLNRDQAIYARDALAKALYERLFTWLVSKLNYSLQPASKKKKTLMGLLDIYGFEIFQKNSFEQFCINYCNEKLQQLFIELTLKSEQEEYFRENIVWEPVEYFNNKIICDLVEERHKGIIAILDEECLRPGEATDITFLSKLEKTVGNHPHFLTHSTANSKVRKTIDRNEFRLVHYAGDVTYNVEGFLDKNNDLLYRDLKQAMIDSDNMIVKKSFTLEEITNKKRPNTAATQFKTSLSLLMNILMSKEPWYIRCIKPNEHKRAGLFDKTVVAHQVKYLGLMENLRVRRAGFAYRKKYEEFLKRYKCLCPDTWPSYEGLPKDGVLLIIQHLNYKSDEYAVGRSKIFIRSAKTLFETEDQYQRHKHALATIIQSKFRSYIQRKKYLSMKKSVNLINRHWRGHLARLHLEERRWAVSVIRKFIKGFICRNQPENEDNASFLWMVKAEFLKRLARNLPTHLLDKSWPSAPASCNEASVYLRKLHRTWLMRKYVKNLSYERKSQLDQKVLAESLFKGKKASYKSSVPTPFASSRLSQELEGKLMSVLQNNVPTIKDKVVYMLPVVKYDRHGYKTRTRILVVTKDLIYLFDDRNLKMKQQNALSSLNAISVSSFNDGFCVLKLPCSNKKEKGDLILDCHEHLIEMVIKLITASGNKKLLTVLDKEKNDLTHEMFGGKKGVITFSEGSTNLTSKGKDGSLKVVSKPS